MWAEVISKGNGTKTRQQAWCSRLWRLPGLSAPPPTRHQHPGLLGSPVAPDLTGPLPAHAGAGMMCFTQNHSGAIEGPCVRLPRWTPQVTTLSYYHPYSEPEPVMLPGKSLVP